MPRSAGLYTQAVRSNPVAAAVGGNGLNLSIDNRMPDPGIAAFYLVSATNAGIEAGLGVNSGGAELPNAFPCP